MVIDSVLLFVIFILISYQCPVKICDSIINVIFHELKLIFEYITVGGIQPIPNSLIWQLNFDLIQRSVDKWSIPGQ